MAKKSGGSKVDPAALYLTGVSYLANMQASDERKAGAADMLAMLLCVSPERIASDVAQVVAAAQQPPDENGFKVPTVGEGVTQIVGSDRYPFTVTRVGPSGRVCWVKADKFERTDSNGFSEDQTYKYEPDPDATEVELRWTGKRWKGEGSTFRVGERRAYQDPCF